MIRSQRIFKLLLLLLIVGSSMLLQAQQEPQYTQFMYNKLPQNAGYTGSREVLSIRALYRNQWTGIKGAPQTASLSIHSPLKKEAMALGANVVNDRLGETNQTWFDLTYAYRVPLGKKVKLSIGINAGILWYKHNLADLITTQSLDPVFQNNVSRILPDVGAGLYLSHPNFYFGASVPNFIKGDLYNKDQLAILPSGVSAHRTAHIILMSGGVIPAGKVLKIRPQVQYRYIATAAQKIPHTFDFNLSLLVLDKVNIGGQYRTTFGKRDNPNRLENGDSFSAMLEVWPVDQLLIGYSYDYTISKLGDYNKGTHEVILGYDFVKEKKRIITPRYF